MGYASEIPDTVSPGLERVIRAVLEDPERTGDATLGVTRAAWEGGLAESLVRGGRIGPQDRDAIGAELRALVERFGAEQAASGFLRYRAGDTLTAVITEVLERRADTLPPATLGEVGEAMNAGLVAELVGAGAIDPDQDETVFAELEALIRDNGRDAVAEDFLGDPDLD